MPLARLALVLIPFCAATALAEPQAVLSHRDRLYDAALFEDRLFVVGHPGHLLRSTDGGQTFQALTAGQGEQALFSIAFNQKGRGIIVGRSGMVLTTEDGGATWAKRQIPKEFEDGTPGLFGVDVAEDGTILAVGEFGLILRSDDGGKTFSRVSYSVDSPEGEEGSNEGEGAPAECGLGAVAEGNLEMMDEARLAAVMFTDSQHAFVVGEFGLLLETSDGGRSFQPRNSCSGGEMLYGLAAVDAQRLLAVGFGGTIVESTDAGRTWRPRPSGTEEDLYAACASDKGVTATGAQGAVVVREGTGDFENIPTDIHTWLVSCAFNAAGEGLIVGGRAHILRTSDGGRTRKHISGD